MRYANLFDFWFDITHCACFILLIQLLVQQMILLYLYQVWFWEKGDNLKKFRSRHKRFFVGILIILFFSKPEIHYMRQGEISVCKVPVPIKIVLVNNDYFLYLKFELYWYQQMNGFLNWPSFYWKTIWRMY